jgi:hypothetical protein
LCAYIPFTHKKGANYRQDTGKIQARYRQDTGKIQARYRQDTGKIQARYRQDTGKYTLSNSDSCFGVYKVVSSLITRKRVFVNI